MRKSALEQNQPQPRASDITNSRIVTIARYSVLNLRHPVLDQELERLQQRGERVGLEARSNATHPARFGHDFSRIPVYPRTTMRTQPKMESGPEDIYEQEADRAAHQALKAPPLFAELDAHNSIRTQCAGHFSCLNISGLPIPFGGTRPADGRSHKLRHCPSAFNRFSCSSVGG